MQLRLLATCDLHAHLMPWDYVTDRPASLGLAQLAPLIRRLRDEVPNCILVDNGDFLQGSPLGDWQERHGTAAHPMVLAMNALGYDAGTLGNHEFSHGLAFLERALAHARFPVVSANLIRGDGGPLVPAYVLLDRTVTDTTGRDWPLRIAITGFAPPQTVLWEALRLDGAMRGDDILTAAERTFADMAVEGPDLTVALAHSGIGSAAPHRNMENAAIPLASLPQIDVIVTGHTHLVFPDAQAAGLPDEADATAGTIYGKPAVMAGFHGSHLGVIDLELTKGPQGWQVSSHRVRAVKSPAIPAADPELARLAAPAHQATVTAMRRPLGHTTRRLHSNFALVAPCATLRLIAEAQLAHWQDNLPPGFDGVPLLAAVAPFRTGGRGGPGNYAHIPPGPILLRHIADIYTHPNTPVLLELSGAEIADWLERAATLFHRISPKAADAALIRPDIPGFDFDLIHGLSFRIDLSQPPRFDAKGSLLDATARRIVQLSLDGRALDPEGRYLLATNSYRAGSGIYPGTCRPPVAQSDVPIADLTARHVEARGTIGIEPGNTWGFAPMPGTTVIFETGPGAAEFRTDIAQFAPEVLGQTDAGFLRFRLSL